MLALRREFELRRYGAAARGIRESVMPGPPVQPFLRESKLVIARKILAAGVVAACALLSLAGPASAAGLHLTSALPGSFPLLLTGILGFAGIILPR